MENRLKICCPSFPVSEARLLLYNIIFVKITPINILMQCVIQDIFWGEKLENQRADGKFVKRTINLNIVDEKIFLDSTAPV